MGKQRSNTKLKTIIKLSSRKEFFARGKVIAKAIDQGRPLTNRKVISFEDMEDMLSFLKQ